MWENRQCMCVQGGRIPLKLIETGILCSNINLQRRDKDFGFFFVFLKAFILFVVISDTRFLFYGVTNILRLICHWLI